MSFKKILRLSLLVISIFAFVSCGLWSKKEEKKFNIDYPPELDVVNKLILEKKTHDAKDKVDDYLNKSENIHWFGHAYFLKAFLYEMDENYEMSIKNYRAAIQHSAKYNSRVEAKSLYNLSFVYERIRNMEKLTTTLVDIMKRREFFDVLTGQVETPARLAASYASLGKMKEAYIFHREASRNFDQMVRHSNFGAPKSEISKSLYYLGLAVYSKDEKDFDIFFKKVRPGQKYLLASAEASKSGWSRKSTKKLLENYNTMWDLIKTYQPKGFDHDPLAKQRQTGMRQLEMAADMYDLMHRIRAEEFPLKNVNKRSATIIAATDKWITRIENFAVRLDLGPAMTRNKPIKQRKLVRFVEKKKEPVRVNKETAKAKASKENKTQKLPPKEVPKTSKDPNL